MRDIELAHKRQVRVVHELKTSGQLVTPNRRYEWLPGVAKRYGLLVLFFELSGNWAMVNLLVILPWSGFFRDELHAGPRDLLFQAELLLYVMLGVHWSAAHLVTVIMCAYDQDEFVIQLGRMIARLTEDVRLSCEQALALASSMVSAAAAEAAATTTTREETLCEMPTCGAPKFH